MPKNKIVLIKIAILNIKLYKLYSSKILKSFSYIYLSF